jgi:hypothetical protein
MNNTQLGTALKDAGMSAAMANANEAYPNWGTEALNALKVFLLWNNSAFMCEMFRVFAEQDCMLPTPPNTRAYGSLMVKAQRLGMIKHAGYRSVSNPRAHRTPASLWVSAKVSA